MDDRRFDRIAIRLSSGASRRRVLAGLGAVATGALVGQGAVTARSARGQCNKDCTDTSRTERRACRDEFTGRERGACLRQAARDKAQCKAACRKPASEG